MSANTLNEVVQTYRESCLTKALSAWMSLASIKYLEDVQVTLEVKQKGTLTQGTVAEALQSAAGSEERW